MWAYPKSGIQEHLRQESDTLIHFLKGPALHDVEIPSILQWHKNRS